MSTPRHRRPVVPVPPAVMLAAADLVAVVAVALVVLVARIG